MSNVINLVAHRKYTIESETYLQPDQRYHESKNCMQLTDGRFRELGLSPSDICRDTDSVYIAFRGISRTVSFTLDEVSSVSGFKAVFSNCKLKQVWAPRRVSLLVSADGEQWQEILKMPCPVDLSQADGTFTTYEMHTEKPYKAKYIRFVFSVDIVTVCCGLEIFGGECTCEAIEPKCNLVRIKDRGYTVPGPKLIGGARDLILMYNYLYSENENEQSWGFQDKRKLLPYVAYVDGDGNIKDTMFDSFMWLPFVRQGPSGGTYHADWRHPNKLVDWLEYRKNLFADGYNLAALDECVGDVSQVLSLGDYRMKVVLCIPYPSYYQTDFGDWEGRGKVRDLSVYGERFGAVKWYIDSTLEMFYEKNYKNLDVVGFYWFEEQIFYNDPHGTRILNEIGDYLHSRDMNFIWIPFYQASGFYEAPDYGFDAVCMQPNLSFNEGFEHTVVRDTAAQAKKYGMCVEIEMADQAADLADDEYIARYNSYLKYLAETRVMTDTVHMYYQNGGPGLLYTCCNSQNPKIRAMYDDTYKFIKHKYRA